MRESECIADQARRMFAGDAWHGPSVSEVLVHVDAITAAAHPIPGAHSIWQLVLHLIATQDVILRRIRGELAGKDEKDFWPPVTDTSPAAWQAAMARLKEQEAKLDLAIGNYPDDKLGNPIAPSGSSAYANFHGHVQHNAYHAGQIALLKKAAAR